jgi:UDP-N-acetylglucosamine--N-acetylmuramyl-(pentapeptide) pyrophosphoryl-undecaprenol N-acetylglucosamine transferase
MNQGRTVRLIVTGGGTGGHTYPALTTLRALEARLAARGQALEALWVGTPDGLEARVAAQEGIAFTTVATGKVRRKSNPLKMISAANMRDMGRVPLGAAQARSLVADYRPDLILATGGFVSVPVGLAAKVNGCPLVVHEQTVRLGLANKVLARVAARFAVSSESTLEFLPDGARARAVVTGNPVRPQMLTGDPDRGVKALSVLGIVDRGLPTIYVTGGAQGSQQINENISRILPWLLQRANVVHQCGPAHLDTLRHQSAALPPELTQRYLLTDYVGAELPDVIALADVVVSRSGAGTLAEITALGKASVLIPLASSAGGEQAHNAKHLQDCGAAVALLGEVNPVVLQAALEGLLTNPDRRVDMGLRARGLGRPDAAERLVDVLLSVIGS